MTNQRNNKYFRRKSLKIQQISLERDVLHFSRYGFIAKIYNMQINTVMGRGTKLLDEMRLSNSNYIVKEHFSHPLFKAMIGKLEYDTLNQGCYFYALGDIGNLKHNFNKYDSKEENNLFLGYYLSLSQMFTNLLWVVKDHGINTEYGFLLIQDNKRLNEIKVTSNSRSSLFSDAKGSNELTIFTKEEILEAISYLDMFNKNFIREIDARSTLEFVNTKSNRIERFFYFLQSARAECHLPNRISTYCTMLETLISTENTEITHKISERTAKMLGETFEDRMDIYQTVKDAYSIRSSTVHGDLIRKKLQNRQVELSVKMDEILRKLFKKIIKDTELHTLIAEAKNEELNEWFIKLILK